MKPGRIVALIVALLVFALPAAAITWTEQVWQLST